MPFREAHHITGAAVKLAESKGVALDALPLAELQAIDARIDERRVRRAVGRCLGRRARQLWRHRARRRYAQAIAEARAGARDGAMTRAVAARPARCSLALAGLRQPAAISSRAPGAALPPAPYGRADRADRRGAARARPAGRARAQRRAAHASPRSARTIRSTCRPKAEPETVMDHFHLRDGVLHAEDVPLRAHRRGGRHAGLRLFARHAGAPRAGVPRGAGRRCAQPHIAFAVKANPNLAVLRVLAARGLSAPTSSRAASWTRALAAGMAAGGHRVLGRRQDRATSWSRALDAGIGQFNLEMRGRGRRAGRDRRGARACARRARCGSIPTSMPAPTTRSRPARRENKFGVPIDRAPAIYAAAGRAARASRCAALAVHIGSQLAELEPLEAAFDKLGALIAELRARGPHGHPRRSRRRARRALQGRRRLPEPGRIRRDGRAGHARTGT